MNLADPELELIDPTPNIHLLFVQFDKMFFDGKLASRAVVRWSKRMYSCAGICSYEGKGGLCDVALSEPLLKLRPRKDLVETLLHEMIHAYLFVTCRSQDRDGHGPNFKQHMYRINKAAGINITIYHSFHAEVKLYQTHWWRCSGPCQQWKPYYGIVKRTVNLPPGPKDYWWNSHLRKCGGSFTKMKEPENYCQKKRVTKTNGNITKYINNVNTNSDVNKPNNNRPSNKILKTIDNNVMTKSKNSNTLLVTQKGSNSSPIIQKSVFSGNGQSINGINRKRTKSANVAETVRNVWANKQILSVSTSVQSNDIETNKINQYKHSDVHSPPRKFKKIDEYFKRVASTVLKDIYGDDIKVTQSSSDRKLIAVITDYNLVPCPVCSSKIEETKINKHLDECLNKDIIEKISVENGNVNKITPTEIKGNTCFPNIKNDSSIEKLVFDNDSLNKRLHNYETSELNNAIIYELDTATTKANETKLNPLESQFFDTSTVKKVNAVVKKINFEKKIRKSDNFLVTKEKKTDEVYVGYLPSFISDVAREINMPPIKIEPEASRNLKSNVTKQKCPCCGNEMMGNSIAEHLDVCLAFFVDSKNTLEKGASTSIANETIVIDDDDDIFDETQTLNATGTKTPCPCCLEMVEDVDMNEHLENCLC